MKAVLVNYNYTPSWLHNYDFDYTIYDRSDSKSYLESFDQERIIYTKNVGNVDYDKLSFLVEHYDTLPDVFLWGKTNLFKYISQEEFDLVDKTQFTPLLTQHHKTYGDICYYENEMYHEINNSWYLGQFECKFPSWKEWAAEFGLPNPTYIPFNPGGNFILTKERVHRYPKEFYSKMRDTMGYTQLPGEAQLAERSYHLLWH